MRICVPASMNESQYFVNQAYVALLQGAGLEPIVVTPYNEIGAVEQVCDGLLLTGGIDIDPTFYNENNIASYNVDPEKDDFERQVLHAFILAGKKVFGICRGFQLIIREWLRANPEMKGVFKYYQHTPDHSQLNLKLARNVKMHDVRYIPSMLYGQGTNEPSLMFVNSLHHQAVVCAPPNKKNANSLTFGGLTNVAITRHGMEKHERGYIVEGVRVSWEGSEMLAVQWHPEELRDYALLDGFFNQQQENVTPSEDSTQNGV